MLRCCAEKQVLTLCNLKIPLLVRRSWISLARDLKFLLLI